MNKEDKCKLEFKAKKYCIVKNSELKYDESNSIIRITNKNGKYKYIPRVYTLFKRTMLSSEELKAIAEKLDELNKDLK